MPDKQERSDSGKAGSWLPHSLAEILLQYVHEFATGIVANTAPKMEPKVDDRQFDHMLAKESADACALPVTEMCQNPICFGRWA